MTAKTGKDEADEVEAVPAEAETEETEAAPKPARPAAKRKRRVRVIEVIDDEDLDEVLEALDAEDAAEAEEEAEEEPPARPAKTVKTAKTAVKPAAKPRPSRLEPPEEADEDAEEAPRKAPARASAGTSGDAASQPMIFGLGMTQAIVAVVLVALLASLAIWQWRSASGLSAEKEDREAVSKVAASYGDVALNYNAQNYQSQMDKAQKLMGGDLLESFKSTTLPSLGETFKSNPGLALTSKTNQVFVGSVDNKFATAVVMVDIDVKTKDGATSAPATLLRLALAKIDGEWKVTKQYASGANDQNQGQGPLPTPTGGASTSPAPDKSEKPGD
ncbi:hypothetical protein [Spirillospora sp. NPDC048823]|uniref:hypothetical protein n=1 Tax=unclassified Spirillospora TaxID=2642701 RepID=UPI003722488C